MERHIYKKIKEKGVERQVRKLVKRGAAVVLAAFLAAPVQMPDVAYGAEAQVSEGAGKAELHPSSGEHAPSEAKGKEDGGEKREQGQRENVASPDNAVSVRTEESAKESSAEKSWREEVRFNTGNYEVCVVDRETFEEGEGDAFFAEDGSYTINIPENNPFFPYEVQFTGEEGTGSRWFMTPEDSVEIDGHEFFVSACFDGTAVTQMSLDVAGDTVVVYPEEKEFTDGDGVQETSLLPLTERHLRVDLTDYTPVELTMVNMKSIFTGENQLKADDKVIWTFEGEDDQYTVNTQEGAIDFSCRYGCWQMIVGDDDQLASENIRYIINTSTTSPYDWLLSTVYREDSEGIRSELTVVDSDYNDDTDDGNRLYIRIPVKEIEYEDLGQTYVGLEVNTELFEKPGYDHFKVYEGNFSDPAKAQAEGTDITDQLFASDMTVTGAGVNYPKEFWVTMISYDAAGKVTGCLPFRIDLYRIRNNISCYSLYIKNDSGNRVSVSGSSSTKRENGCDYRTVTLSGGYPADGKYFQRFNYYRLGTESNELVTAAYVGKYSSIKEAVGAGAEDKKDILLDPGDGYEADYSKGVYFTFFVGEDGAEEQEIYWYSVKTEAEELTKPTEPVLSDSTGVNFYNLWDEEGHSISCYPVSSTEDFYADYSYRTILVDSDVDLTCLAPEFSINTEGINLYASEGDSESVLQVSKKSLHDFSKGPVHYTASSESKKTQRNYWLQVVKKTEGEGKLYINSLADPDAGTSAGENGAVVSTREMVIDGRYDYYHDILLINQGTEALANLVAEIDSEEVELDSYWTLKGEYPLAGFDSLESQDSSGRWVSYGELSNMAKLRVIPKENMSDGRDISGTLKIKSGDKVLAELTLTGTVGDPSITTAEIPDGVKYVPYGTMIQNSNKYEWNEVSYTLTDGKLPEGMVIKPNGELYGVPTETGEFTFTVQMENSYEYFGDSVKTFTFNIAENTDSNVDGATDQGYELTSRVQSITLNSSADQTMVSEGIYDEFVDLYLDGEKLEEGVDYVSESGSTRITIKSQTLKRSNTAGTHTLGIEFRTKDTDTLKRAAQNYEIRRQSSGGGGSSSGGSSSGGSNSGGSTSGGSKNSGSVSNTPSVTTDSKKGYVNSATGIITGEGEGYSRWMQEESGWKLIYADGAMAAGAAVQLESGNTAEQVIWEQVNGSWYAFGANGYVKSGWVYDYQLGSWYLTSVDSGMQSGWYTDPQDKCTYYLEPGTGKLAAGWKMIDGKWYYFQAVSQAPTWELNRETGNWFYNAGIVGRPFGSMYRDERTPDGYVVDGEGRWNEEER